MRDREYVFLRSGRTPEDEGKQLLAEFGLEPIPNTDGARPDQVGLRGPARTREGAVGFEIQPNVYPLDDPEPDEVQAIDGYPLEIGIWLGKNEGTQGQEARLVFDQLVATRPEVAMLLCHNVSGLVAAYLPGRGVHDFPPGTTIDAADQELWRDWVLA